jgi:hypothetical protein
MKEVILPSGAKLLITLPPFDVSKALYQAVLKELRGLEVRVDMQLGNLWKELFCIGFSSPEIETALWKCFEKCNYNNVRLRKELFESEEARGDYIQICVEVAAENIAPFVKSLSSSVERLSSIAESFRK